MSVKAASKNGVSAIRNRIIGHGECDPMQLLANERNARVHPPRQQLALNQAIDKLGWIDEVIVNKRTAPEWGADRNVETVVDGHLRVSKAITDRQKSIPVKYVDLTPDEERYALAAFDRITELATWDGALLDSLRQDGVSLDTLWDADELDALLAGLGGSEPPADPGAQVDKVAELQAKWNVQRGDLWTIGRHRLLCGDSTVAADVARVMGGERAVLMVTDPPYGIEHDSEWREQAGISSMGAQTAKGIEWDANADWTRAYQLSNAQVVFVWHASINNLVVAMSLSDAGYVIKQMIIWNKTVAAFGRSHYSYKHDPCWFAVKKGQTANWHGPNNEVTVWDIASPLHIMGGSNEDKQPHATQKPLECMERPIVNHTAPSEIVYDPFLGSGTTLVACERTGRAGRGIEIEPKYCAVTLERLAGMGLVPERAEA